MRAEGPKEKRIFASGYRHADWERRRLFLRFLLRNIGFTLLAKLDKVEGLEHLPAEGPAILMINHIAFIDPIVVLHVASRNIVPLAKIEVYKYPLVGIFPHIWGVIPVRREEFDRRAVQGVLEVLRAGEIVLVAPEGTRGPQLSRGKEGVAYLASRSGVPVIPVAIEGTDGFPALRFFSAAWRKPGVYVRFGRPFRYRPALGRPDRDLLRKMTDEAIYVLAGMLPEKRRGVYSDLSQATQVTIEWV
ncbi:MAG TPA: lysophospholipid acyltransferase family protein [Anaerolineales bacterium]|nr:lysophospholipid acyltransferase family protein [Anaerolineales bacterium]